jgi:hypothetical protein
LNYSSIFEDNSYLFNKSEVEFKGFGIDIVLELYPVGVKGFGARFLEITDFYFLSESWS